MHKRFWITLFRTTLCWAMLCCLIMPGEVSAQQPSEEWRTLEIPGFRFHTPVASEPWTRQVAQRMEQIQARVEAEVGYSPQETVDVLVIDPIARANGMAWPIMGRPRMLLYTTPPPADSVLGHFTDWSEILALHEAVHLAHLLRPSRNPRTRLLEHWVPIGPLVKKAPKWVIEGYATLLEGRLTGWGRPYGDFRAALLRRWAQTGTLPSYGALSGTSRRWLGRAFPYLVGSAYLEWLEQRAGEESLRALWARLSARRERSFDEAFRGVYGESPSKLYQRFTAELTYRAMTLEADRAGVIQQGELWQDTVWQTGPPALSPDGERLAVVLRRRGLPSRLVVLSTADDPEAETKWHEAQERMLELDPDDVAAVRTKPLPREPVFELPPEYAGPSEPRFVSDGSVIFTLYDSGSSDAPFAGAQIPDLYRWWPERGVVERVTRDAGVRRSDPSPDGSWAVSVRHVHGMSELVRTDLRNGEVEPLLDRRPTVGETVDYPRLSPDGSRLLYLAHSTGASDQDSRSGGWKLVVRHLESGTERIMPTPQRARLMHPAWESDDSIVATVGIDGFLDIYRFNTTIGARQRLTQSTGAALAPTPGPNGLFFLAMEDDGLDIRRLPSPSPGLEAWHPTLADLERWVPVVRLSPPESVVRRQPPESDDSVALDSRAPVLDSEPYGLGPREHFPLIGGSWGPDGERFEFGLRQGDPVGRLELWLLGSVADTGAGTEGAGLAARWKGSALETGARAYSVRETGPGGRLRYDGLELSWRKSAARRKVSWLVDTGVLWDRVELNSEGSIPRAVVFAEGAAQWRQSRGPWRLSERVAGSFERGDTDGEAWTRYGYDVGLWLGRRPPNGMPWRLGLTWSRAGSEDLAFDFDRYQLGGQKGSLLPDRARARRQVPALPSWTVTGNDVESQRLELELASLPITLFGERHRVWNEPTEKRWLRITGLEWTLSQGPMPILRLPGVELTLGVARSHDAPYEDRTEGWVGVRWRP